ncbi:S49 family peptidase [Rhodanobacter sp. FW106-PBR-R2A-1-13]|uniref:S49 family peptidase n=1 Tax=Rhodanobacter sp. FW106-PBR-R2A-1-13 TaxID=3454845 RepID=UPI0034E5AAC4
MEAKRVPDDPNQTDHPSPNDRLAGAIERLEPALVGLLSTVTRERRSSGLWSLVKRAGIVLMFFLGLLVWSFIYGTAFGIHPTVIDPTVAQVEIDGAIGSGNVTSADNVVPMLQSLCKQPNVRGLVLHISSPGGSPGDAERIGAAVDTCKAMPLAKGQAHPPAARRRVVAVIDGLGASAGYMIALHADEIVANPTGMVGSIGVIIEGLKYDALMQKVGVSSYAYASGPLKTMLSPYAADTPAQKAVAQELANAAMQVFRREVMTRRPHLDTRTPDLWSGRVWVAGDAVRMGLIDKVGLLEPVEASEFPALQVQSFRPTRDVRGLVNLSTWVDAFRESLMARPVSLQ